MLLGIRGFQIAAILSCCFSRYTYCLCIQADPVLTRLSEGLIKAIVSFGFPLTIIPSSQWFDQGDMAIALAFIINFSKVCIGSH